MKTNQGSRLFTLEKGYNTTDDNPSVERPSSIINS